MTYGGPGKGGLIPGGGPKATGDFKRPASTAKSGGWAQPKSMGGHVSPGNKAHLGMTNATMPSSAGRTSKPTALHAKSQAPQSYQKKTITNIGGSGFHPADFNTPTGHVKSAYRKPIKGTRV